MDTNIRELKCLRCSHVWFPRQKEVRICAKCKSAWWDKPKQAQRIVNKLEAQHKIARRKAIEARSSSSLEEFKAAEAKRDKIEDRAWKVKTRLLNKGKNVSGKKSS